MDTLTQSRSGATLGAPGARGGATIAFGCVRHQRLRPCGNAFEYGSYFLRLPVRELPDALAGTRLIGYNRWNLFAFHDRDHGGRDGGDLAEWIDALLRANGVDDATGPVWLHAFPRVLGYVFNPVSFWFCHREDGTLRAILCEVNNTFGESHCYLLDHADGRALRFGEELEARKVFHVSPFCRIEGRYRFRFMVTAQRSVMRIDYDDLHGPLLKTSLSGTHVPLSDARLLWAFLRFPLFTLGVIARIHWQAARLWIKRVPFIPKPDSPAAEANR